MFGISTLSIEDGRADADSYKYRFDNLLDEIERYTITELVVMAESAAFALQKGMILSAAFPTEKTLRTVCNEFVKQVEEKARMNLY